MENVEQNVIKTYGKKTDGEDERERGDY